MSGKNVTETLLVNQTSRLDRNSLVDMVRKWGDVSTAVSYTHLTLPTNREV